MAREDELIDKFLEEPTQQYVGAGGPVAPNTPMPQAPLTPQQQQALVAQREQQLADLNNPYLQGSPPGVSPPMAAPIPQGPPGQIPAGPIAKTLINPASPQQALKEMALSGDKRKAIIAAESHNLTFDKEQEAGIYSNFADDQAKSLAMQKMAWDQHMEAAESRDSELRTMIQEAHKQQVDPDRWWNNKSTAGKATSIIGLLLGGLGGGFSGKGGNAGMDAMNNLINNDINAQRSNMENSWKAVNETHGLNNDAMARTMHDDAWQTQHRVGSMEVMKLQLQQAAAKTASVSVRNNALNAIEDIDKMQLLERQKLWQMSAAAAGASAARLDKLAKERRDTRAKLLEKEGADPVAIDKALDKDFGMLAGTPYASVGQQQEAANRQFALQKAQEIVQKSNGKIKLDQAYGEVLKRVNEARPAYEAAYGRGPGEGNGDGTLNTPRKLTEQRTQLTADLNELQSYLKDVNTISPSLVEGVSPTTVGLIKHRQEQYKTFVYELVAKKYKEETGANEPRNSELIQKLAAPYLPTGIYEPVEVTKRRMESLAHDLQRSSVGITGQRNPAQTPGAPPAAPPANAADPFVPTRR